MPSSDLAIPFFGYKSHVSIDQKFRFIGKWKTTNAAASDDARLREGLLDKTNIASGVWADTAYRSKANEDFMEKQGFVSKVHRKKLHLNAYAPTYPAIQRRKVRDPVTCRACLCRPEITDGIVDPNCRYHPDHHEDRPGQYRLQHAPFPLPGADQRECVVLQRETAMQEIRRLVVKLAQRRLSVLHILSWSVFRRTHQASANRAHSQHKMQLCRSRNERESMISTSQSTKTRTRGESCLLLG